MSAPLAPSLELASFEATHAYVVGSRLLLVTANVSSGVSPHALNAERGGRTLGSALYVYDRPDRTTSGGRRAILLVFQSEGSASPGGDVRLVDTATGAGCDFVVPYRMTLSRAHTLVRSLRPARRHQEMPWPTITDVRDEEADRVQRLVASEPSPFVSTESADDVFEEGEGRKLIARLRSLGETGADTRDTLDALTRVVEGYERSLAFVRSLELRIPEVGQHARFRAEPPALLGSKRSVQKGEGRIGRVGSPVGLDGLLVYPRDALRVHGWWVVEGLPVDTTTQRFLCLLGLDGASRYYASLTSNMPRMDVVEARPTLDRAETMLSGFDAVLDFALVRPGAYRIHGLVTSEGVAYFTPFAGSLEIARG